MASSTTAGATPPSYFVRAGGGTDLVSGVVSAQQPTQVGLYPSGQLGLQTQFVGVDGAAAPAGVMFTAQQQAQAVYMPLPTNAQPQLIALSPSYGCSLGTLITIFYSKI